MNPVSVLVVFLVVWWLVFFMLLPVGVVMEENPEPGHARSAPKNPHLKVKMIASTILSVIVTTVFFYLSEKGYLDFLNIG